MIGNRISRVLKVVSEIYLLNIITILNWQKIAIGPIHLAMLYYLYVNVQNIFIEVFSMDALCLWMSFLFYDVSRFIDCKSIMEQQQMLLLLNEESHKGFFDSPVR